jgi:hypothetical protein
MIVGREGRVAVWIGQFTDEPALRSYVEVSYDGDESSCPFWADTGTDWFDEDFLEAEFRPDGLAAAQLVAEHSYGYSFAAAVDAAVRHLAMEGANAVIVAYDAEYAPVQTAPTGRIWFVGTFDYQRR